MAKLPNDPDNMNIWRAGAARVALNAFQEATGTYDSDALGDLLGDLLHLCDQTDAYGTFDEGLRLGRTHHRDETHGERGA
jgi:hypothetical protein